MYNEEKFQDLKNSLESAYSNVTNEVVSKYAEEVKAYTKENIKHYVWDLLPALIADDDISKFGFDKEEDFYKFVDFAKVRNKLRKDFRDELMTEIMQDLQRKNLRQQKTIDILVKILKNIPSYNFSCGNDYNRAVEALQDVGIDITKS